jgi:RecB family exonuclease
MRLTTSELKTFQRCRRQWWLRYYRHLGLRAYKPTGPIAIGNRVHNALELYYANGIDPVTTVRDTLAADIEAMGADDELIIHINDVMKDGELCIAMVEGYMQWLEEEGVDSDLEVIEVEQALEVELRPGVTLLGKIDARVRRRSDGARLFLDHKTVQDFSAKRTLHLDPQMLHYHLLEFLKLMEDGKDAENTRTDGGLYNMIRKVKRTKASKPPFFERHEVRHNIESLRSYWIRVVALSEEMQRVEERLDAGEDPRAVVPPTPTKNCSWDCDFFAVCPMFDDGSDAESVIHFGYEEIDTLARYGENPEGI